MYYVNLPIVCAIGTCNGYAKRGERRRWYGPCYCKDRASPRKSMIPLPILLAGEKPNEKACLDPGGVWPSRWVGTLRVRVLVLFAPLTNKYVAAP